MRKESGGVNNMLRSLCHSTIKNIQHIGVLMIMIG